MAANTPINLRRLKNEYRIKFDAQGRSDSWPEFHRATFGNIKALGKKEYESYCAAIDIGTEQQPWRAQIKSRAKRISDMATRCYEARKNEAGWRLNLESEILKRFTIEVNCANCSARLWRSEIEAAVSISAGRRESEGPKGRRIRPPCKCGPNGRPIDPLDQGINPLFDERAEDAIQYEDRIMSALNKGHKPDRIYGLRENKMLERLLLNTLAKDGRFLQDRIVSCPFVTKRKDEEAPLHFPFLILEAKSEKGGDSSSDIEDQTAFAIRALLMLQDSLKQEAEQESYSGSPPLLWFLSNKGEDWHIAAAYVGIDEEGKRYDIVDLWHGNIREDDAALQLLLIIDYIFDWARNVYRHNIIHQLWSLTGRNLQSLKGDPDVVSTLADTDFYCNTRNVDPWMENLISSDPGSVAIKTDSSSIPEVLRTLDCTTGVIRDARFFRTRLYGLYITKNNIIDFLKSADTMAKSQKIARDLQRFLINSVRVEESALERLETIWIGTTSDNPISSEPGRQYMVQVCITAYLTQNWEQILELTYVAVEVSVTDTIKNYAAMMRGWLLEPDSLPLVADEDFLKVPEAIRHSSSQRDVLMASINQRRLIMGSKWVTEFIPGYGATHQMTMHISHQDNATGASDVTPTRSMFVDAYVRCRIGMRPPSESFLREFSCNCEQGARQSSLLWSELIGGATYKQRLADDENVICIKNTFQPHDICLFLVDGPPDYVHFPRQLQLKMNLTEHFLTSLETESRMRSRSRAFVRAESDFSKNRRALNLREFQTLYRDIRRRGRLLSNEVAKVKSPKSATAFPDAESVGQQRDPRELHFVTAVVRELSRLRHLMVKSKTAGQEGRHKNLETGNLGWLEDLVDEGQNLFVERLGCRKRSFDQTEEDSGSAAGDGSTERLAWVNPTVDLNMESDHLGDEDFEVLLQTGCFGHPGASHPSASSDDTPQTPGQDAIMLDD